MYVCVYVYIFLVSVSSMLNHMIECTRVCVSCVRTIGYRDYLEHDV